MYYFIAALVLFAVIALFYKIILPENEPNFELMGLQSDESLGLSVMNIAAKSKNFKEHGKGLSVRLIQSKTRRAFKIIKRKIDSGQACHDFEHWIYDNYYKINEAILKQKKQFLTYCKLPHVKDLPRIYNFLNVVVKASGGGYSKELLAKLTDDYCAVTPLMFCEINALKSVLEYCLLEFIAIFCAKALVIADKDEAAKNDAKKGRVNLSQINYNSYIGGMDKYTNAKLRNAVENICLSNGLEMNQRLDNFYRQVATYVGSIQAAITNLHKTVSLDDEYIIGLSPLNQLLMQTKEINYFECTLATRSVYLYHIGRISRRKRVSELAYARSIMDKSEREKIDIANLILPKNRSRMHMRFYIFTAFLLSFALSIIFGTLLLKDALWLLLPLYPIVFGIVIVLSHEFLGIAIKRRFLPSKKLLENEHENAKTMILFSRLIADEAEIEDTFRHLETIKYANSEPFFSYGVLIDFPASSSSDFSEKEIFLTSLIKEKYNKLRNMERYNIFIRKKTQIMGEKRFQGWEKKRGALLELNNLILQDQHEKFDTILGDSFKTKYIVALDSDTLLNCAKELVELMEHPYNKNKNVISLSIGTNPSSANKTNFSRFMSGFSGLGNYSMAASDVSFDVYGHGNYTGKGIYRIKEFQNSVSDKFLDNRILSHDFIEGAMAGCANCSEKALDNFPSDFSSYIMRQQRWLRGDWQLLPYLFGKIKNREGRKIKNPIAPIDKWHIFCNLLTSLIPISSLFVLILSLFVSNSLLILLLSFSLNIIYILNSIRISALKNPRAAAQEFFRQVYSISCLPIIALFSLYSIIITLVRLIRKKKLLEWKVFAHSKGKNSFLPNLIVAVIITSVAILLNKNLIYYIISAIFLSAPLVNNLISKERKEKKREELICSHEEMLRTIAKKTWSFFEEQLTSGLTLVSDNYQEYLELGYAMRTSPTNIGLSLVSICSAYELGFINIEKLNEYIENIISKIERVDKWHGNLYNWIDLGNFKPLNPKYVSSVDSGNLLASLLISSCYVTHSMLKERIFTLIEETKIEKLYDEKRGLFYIGYNDSDKTLDKNHYDLMASESIITYLASVGLGLVSKSSWNNLSRQHVRYHGDLLYSWTGGAFEYLMPSIFYAYPKHGMLDVSAKNVIKANVKYAKEIEHSFWGISESQYNSVDNNGCYQYKAFGVPKISLANSKSSRVFTPYATFLALPFLPKLCLKNIQKMQSLGLLNQYGFYEACDDGEVIKSYMAHHQGMILASITNFLTNNCLQKRMLDNPSVRAAELLLTQPKEQSRAKKKIRALPPYKKTTEDCQIIEHSCELPKINLLSGGKYNLLIDQYGKGYSLFEDLYISRPDNNSGMEISVEYSKENTLTQNTSVDTKNAFDTENTSNNTKNAFDTESTSDSLNISGNSQKRKINLADGIASFDFYSARFSSINEDISTSMTVFVLPNISGEVRDIRIKNISNKNLDILLSSFMELSLSTKNDYLAHRAYSNMFLYSEFKEKEDFLLVRRKNKKTPYFAYYFNTKGVKYSASRADSFDRAKTKNSYGHTLDTAVSGKLSKTLAPYEEIRVQIFSLVSYDLEYLKRQIKMTRSQGYLKRVSAETFSIGRQLNPGNLAKNAALKLLFKPKNVQNSLNEYGINLDIPLILFDASNTNALERLKIQLKSLKKLYKFDISFNTVILYDEKSGYFTHAKNILNETIDESGIRAEKNYKSTIIFINKRDVSDEIMEKIKKSATDISKTNNNIIDYSFVGGQAIYKNAELLPLKTELDLGIGGFLKDGSYFMDLTNINTPAAWSNIIANQNFGTLITESGGGYTYYKNSRENKLTSWSNDCFGDNPSEAIILQEGNISWSLAKKPIKTNSSYHVIHGFGYSEFINNYNGILARQKEYINKNTKFFDIVIENKTDEAREISIAAIIETVLGTNLTSSSSNLEFRIEGNCIVATNTKNGSQLFINSSKKLNEYAFFRESFSDEDGNINRACGFGDDRASVFGNKEASVFKEKEASEFGDKGYKKCIAYSVNVALEKNGESRVVFSLGTEKDVDFSNCDKYLIESKEFYSNLSTLKIETDNKELGYLLKWLPYQTLTSRFFAKTGFYQAGGAVGFRDQLQDCLTVLYINPSLVRQHILKSAKHQFEDGDVQHWWHEPAIGVRTKITDDRLFLPYVVGEYIEFTGDKDILLEKVPYLKNIELPHGQHSIYASVEETDYSVSILEHCIMAIKSSLRFGENGLMLMGGGDWNDAMDLIGIKGKGTSVWCSMFMYDVINRFLIYVTHNKDSELFFSVLEQLKFAVDSSWDGEWFLRAFTDDGREVGGKSCQECKIDLITQSFAKISGIASDEKCEIALKSAAEKLVDKDNKIIRLLSPPFEKTEGIGYISSYPKGVRENGGQYTHGAIWFIISLFKSGKNELAYELLNMINPINHSKTVDDCMRYAVEPYVLAADVYADEHAGRGGWTWYTGAASWLYKCIIENLFGLQIKGDEITINPNLPSSLKDVKIEYKTPFGVINLIIENTNPNNAWHLEIDKIKQKNTTIKLEKSIVGKTIRITNN